MCSSSSISLPPFGSQTVMTLVITTVYWVNVNVVYRTNQLISVTYSCQNNNNCHIPAIQPITNTTFNVTQYRIIRFFIMLPFTFDLGRKIYRGSYPTKAELQILWRKTNQSLELTKESLRKCK